MMQSLRENMKLIIWITAVVFLVGFGILELGGVLGDNTGAGGAPRGVIAKINGDPVRYEEFMQLYRSMTEQLTRERPLQEGEDSYIREQAWRQILQAKLMEQEARRRGIEVTPEEIKAALRLTPPDFLMQAPVFLTDGQFDYRKYLAEMDNPNSQLPWGQVEAMVAAQLPTQKLQQEIIAEAKICEGDVRDRFLLQNERLHIRYIGYDPDSFPVDTTRIGGADIENYYKAHPQEFSGPRQVKVQVLLVPRTPNQTDFAAARERLQGILDQIKAQPDSFEAFARTYSEIGSAAAGGDTPGEPYVDDLRPAFRSVLRDLKEGQLSPVIQEERSLHLFRVDKLYPDEKTGRTRIHYHEIAIRVQPGPEAIQAIREGVAQVQKEGKRDGVAAVATRHGYRTFQSNYFAQGKSQNSVFERFPEVELWCFKAKEGSVSRAVPTEAGWYLYQILDRREAGLRPLEAVRDEAKLALIRSLRKTRAEEAAKRARAAVLAGMPLEEAARQTRGFVGEEQSLTRNGVMGRLGRDPRSAGMLFAVPVQSWSPVITGERTVFSAQVVEHHVPSEEDFQKQAATLRENLLNERRQIAFTEWMNEVRRRAKIEDYRENYFEA